MSSFGKNAQNALEIVGRCCVALYRTRSEARKSTFRELGLEFVAETFNMAQQGLNS